MNETKTLNSFLVGMVALALLIGGLAYYFGYRPLLEAKSEAIERREAAEERNDFLRLQIATKTAEAKKVPEYEAEIAEIQIAFPPTLDMVGVKQELEEILALEGLTATALEDQGRRYLNPGEVDLQAAAGQVGRMSSVHELQFEGLVANEFKFQVSGPWDGFIRFMARLQLDTDRYFLVSPIEFDSELSGESVHVDATFSLTVFTVLDDTLGLDPLVPPSALDEDGELLPAYVGAPLFITPPPAE